MIPDSTNVRVMADNIRKLKTEVENAVELPSVETTDEGKVLTVNSSGKWTALDLPPSIPKDYSTTEMATGLKWVDGKEIYCKVLSATFPSDASAVVAGNIGLHETVIELAMLAKTAAGTSYIITSGNNTVSSNGDVSTGTSLSVLQGRPFNMIVRYTKASPTREPDDEPETKKSTKRKTTKGEN